MHSPFRFALLAAIVCSCNELPAADTAKPWPQWRGPQRDDLSSETGTEAVMDEAVRRFGPRRIRCFHLNDSARPRGARVDRHANIGRGAIGLPAFRYLVNDERFQQTPAVLETPDPGRYARGLRLLHSLIRK